MVSHVDNISYFSLSGNIIWLMSHVRFINSQTYYNLQLSGVCVFVRVGGRTVSVPEPEYSVQGYASATLSHATAHKAHISPKNPLGYVGLNADGLKVPL